jgi:hypothetical protein
MPVPRGSARARGQESGTGAGAGAVAVAGAAAASATALLSKQQRAALDEDQQATFSEASQVRR